MKVRLVYNNNTIDNGISYMIYKKEEEYKVTFYKDIKTDRSSVLEYIDKLTIKERAKISKYINFLKVNKGVLDEPYSKHIKGKIRELRVDFSNSRHRIFYFTFVGKNIIFLHAFLKKTAKTPVEEIKKAENNYYNIVNNHKTKKHEQK
jgi:phage-related protein